MEGKEIAKKIFYVVGIVISFLGYFLRISPIIEISYGTYIRGLLDGGVATLILMAIIFYVSSFFGTNTSTQDTKKPQIQNIQKPQEKLHILKVDLKTIEEIIKKLDNVERIFTQVVDRAGGFDTLHILRVNVTQNEDAEFKKNIHWLAENYPPIAGESSMGMRMSYIDQLRGIRVNDYDPLLQIIQNDSLSALFERGTLYIRDFRQNLQGSKAKIRAYSGYLKRQGY